jgi:hypothetical protein
MAWASNGPHGMLVERGHEHDRRHAVSSDRLDHGKAIDLGHLHIEEDEIGRERANGGDRRRPIPALSDDLDARLVPEQPQDPATGDRFIIDDHDTNAHGERRQGSSISAMTPPSAESRTSKRWRSP